MSSSASLEAMFVCLVIVCRWKTDRVKGDSVEWAAATASLLRRLSRLPMWKPVVTQTLSAHISTVTVSIIMCLHCCWRTYRHVSVPIRRNANPNPNPKP